MSLSDVDRSPWWNPPNPSPGWDPHREFARLSSAVLSCTAQVLGDSLSPDAVVQRYCQMLADASDHLPLVWCWFGPADTPVIRPDVCAGRARDWAASLAIQRNWLTRRGPAYRALRGEAIEPFRISRLSPWAPWRQAARLHGVRSVLCLPVPSSTESRCGVLVVYADRPDYFDRLVRFFEPVGELFGTILSRTVERQALERAAVTDALTGLGNRHALAQVQRELAAADLALGSVLVIDLDHFKRVNDTHGHAVGDRLLAAVAGCLRQRVRRIDDVMRIGGEEFVVVLRGVSLAGAQAVAEDLRKAIEALAVPLDTGPPLATTATLGVTDIRPGEPLDAVIHRADLALYDGKRQGRNRVVPA